jgi:hypothetical protein
MWVKAVSDPGACAVAAAELTLFDLEQHEIWPKYRFYFTYQVWDWL